MWLEETIGDRINRKRTAEAMTVSPKHIATACPFCLIMLDDGVKDLGVEETVKTLDIAEIVARSLGDKAPAAAPAETAKPPETATTA